MKTPIFSNLLTLTAFLLGSTAGYFQLSFLDVFLEGTSELFLKGLRLLSVPMIFLAIVSTASQMQSLQEAKFLAKKVLKYTITTTLIAALIGLFLFLIFHPEKKVTTHAILTMTPKETYLSTLFKLVPSNFLEPFLEHNVIGAAFIATLFSIAILTLPSKQSVLIKDFFHALFNALLKITSWIIALMPLGIFAFSFQFFKNISDNQAHLNHLFLYSLCILGANVIQGFIILPLMLKWKKLSPLKIAQGMIPALSMAFFSKSSSATLPLTLKAAKQRLNISEKTAHFSFPLCSIINMNGCAAFILITFLFVSTSHGIPFTPFQLIGLVFVASIAAIGNAGVPMGCFFLTSALLVGMDIPLSLMGMILPLYSLFDMVETALNVWSDSCITVIVDKQLTEKTQISSPLLSCSQGEST